LGNPVRAQAPKPVIKIVEPPVAMAATGTDGPVFGAGYDPARDYDMPTSIRQNARRSSQAAVELAQSAGIDTLDIPAFLRKQAD
ncbi:MAG TPA: hypothetical protein PK437_00005, partial [Thiobacillaceae bacterium]|nr:hypothetical protein [Thiobacillaceae bacterium]